mmetsp:Transcript_10793/g.24048  ORF Transcript_10793/g.24048 Transcript_10793/m.24048 type:complete len:472 (-) Transcript_10793:46-1461(-)
MSVGRRKSTSQQNLGFLHVVVQSGHNLPAADRNLFQPFKSTSDPYVILTFGAQKYRTRVQAKTLNPTWGEACTFQVGSFTHIHGRDWQHRGMDGDDETVLWLDVWDKDTWTEDDPLGKGSLRLNDVFRQANAWCRKKIKLQPPEGVSVSGSIHLMVLFQRESRLPFYAVRLVPAILHFVGGALFLIAARCRWQHPLQQAQATDELMQPGVGSCVLLAGILSWVAGVVDFLAIHLGWSYDKRMLAKSSVASGLHHSIEFLHKRYPLEEVNIQHAESLVDLKAKALGLSEYEINLNTRCDCQLPVLVIFILLPHAAEALGGLALLLQCQEWSLSLCAGELLDLSAVALEIASVYLALLVVYLLEPTDETPMRSNTMLKEEIQGLIGRLWRRLQSYAQDQVQPPGEISMRKAAEECFDELSDEDREGDLDSDSEEHASGLPGRAESERRVGWWRSVFSTGRQSEGSLGEPLLHA